MTLEFIGLGILLLLSAFFSGSEMGFILSNKLKIEIKAKSKKLSAANAHYFASNPERLFSTVLIGNNIVNITFASLFSIIFEHTYHLNEFQIIILSTLLMLFIGEVTPKYLVSEAPSKIFLLAANPLRVLSFIFYPIVKLTVWLSKLISDKKEIDEEKIAGLFNKDDLEFLVQESEDAGHVTKQESDVIKNILDLGDRNVLQCMRPRTDVVAVNVESTIDEVLDAFIDSGYSKLPVYEEEIDNIIGFVLTYDLFSSPKNLKSILRTIIYVPETKKNSDMLKEFLKKRVSLAVVIDEHGGVAGIVTMEDILEELFGEIKDEYDVEEQVCRELKEGEYLVSGNVEVSEINERFNLGLDEGDYQTIAGYIITNISNIPKQGESVTIQGFNFHIVRATPVRIELIKIKKNEE